MRDRYEGIECRKQRCPLTPPMELQDRIDLGTSLPNLGLSKRLAQQFEALRDGGERVFPALVFERYPTGELNLLHDRRNPGVVEVERIPDAAAEVGLGLE